MFLHFLIRLARLFRNCGYLYELLHAQYKFVVGGFIRPVWLEWQFFSNIDHNWSLFSIVSFSHCPAEKVHIRTVWITCLRFCLSLIIQVWWRSNQRSKEKTNTNCNITTVLEQSKAKLFGGGRKSCLRVLNARTEFWYISFPATRKCNLSVRVGVI